MSSFNKRSGHRLLTTSDLASVTKDLVKETSQVYSDLTDIDVQQINSSGDSSIILTKRNTLIIITITTLPINIILPNPTNYVGYTVSVKYSAPFSVNGITVSTVPGSLVNAFNPGAVTLPKSSDTPVRFIAVKSTTPTFSWEVF